MDNWPPIPLLIYDGNTDYSARPLVEDNIIAALEHNDRVCQITLMVLELGYLINSAAILKPFPELTYLMLSNLERERILSDSFLGGSAPRLRTLHLSGLSFPRLPKLLLSTTHLVKLDLSFPRSGYIPPEVMATSLESLRLEFQYPQPHPALETRRPPPPLTRTLLSLTIIEFKGTSEYLELILARVDAPRLDRLRITFFNQLIFDTPQLFHFISRSPRLRERETGHIEFFSEAITVEFSSKTSAFGAVLDIGICCTASEWQLSSLEQFCTSSLPPVSTLEDLYISEDLYTSEDDPRPLWQDDVENRLWLDLLRSFVAVKNLYISVEFLPRIAPVLQELVGGRTTEVLPTLENILLEGFQPTDALHEGIEKFVTARLCGSHPVAVSSWNQDRTRTIISNSRSRLLFR